jgi:hypothetical protein
MRGGKRANAGRPRIHPEENRVQMSLSVSPTTKRNATTMREAGVPVTRNIEQYIEQMMAEWLEGQDFAE